MALELANADWLTSENHFRAALATRRAIEKEFAAPDAPALAGLGSLLATMQR
jgi:hypothetical protein